MNVKQFGFTNGRSTAEAGVELIQQIFDAWEDSRDTIGVFCDLYEACNCVYHDALIRKVHPYESSYVTGRSIALLESYLRCRIQRVDVNSERSSRCQYGCATGSVPEPFPFLFYINDLLQLVKDGYGIVLFADNTSLLFKINRKQPAFDEINSIISEIVEWFSINNLLISEKKTKLVQFSLTTTKTVNGNAMIKNEILNIVDKTLFLGLTLDAKLR
ncbi:Probable RNA-directed DNA polymerase from transposon BS [Eumeta japonica]|uniref:Probable RNA-directed DNA polymerase from transposon BS n=1 Tax=Eumeta variegata TaxID=151549 RepID=A0A4C1WS65_EUMVA|nr:Probable RNA-directed DNA polymerase from transposon BS [Eumeta japonica]